MKLGKWYVPNPENEVDLEKLRIMRLLKLFEVCKLKLPNQNKRSSGRGIKSWL